MSKVGVEPLIQPSWDSGSSGDGGTYIGSGSGSGNHGPSTSAGTTITSSSSDTVYVPPHLQSLSKPAFLSSSFIQPSSFHLSSANFQNAASLSSPIFMMNAAAMSADPINHNDTMTNGNPAISPTSNRAFTISGGPTRERNVLEQQRLKNARRIVEHLSQIEISCNEDVQNDCKSLMSILRRTLKVDTVLIVNGDVSRVLFDANKTKQFHPLLATDRLNQKQQNGRGRNRLNEHQLQQLTAIPGGAADRTGVLRTSSTSVQLSHFLSNTIGQRAPAFPATSSNANTPGVNKVFPLQLGNGAATSPTAATSGNRRRVASTGSVGGDTYNSKRSARSASRDDVGTDGQKPSIRGLFPSRATNKEAIVEPGIVIPRATSMELSASFHRYDDRLLDGGGSSFHSSYSGNSYNSTPAELSAMVFGQPFLPPPSSNQQQDSKAQSKTARTTSTVTSSDRTAKSRSLNRVVPWYSSTNNDRQSKHDDDIRNDSSIHAESPSISLHRQQQQSIIDEESFCCYYDNELDFSINDLQQQQQHKIRPVFVSNDVHQDVRVSTLTKTNLEGVVRYFVATKVKVGVNGPTSIQPLQSQLQSQSKTQSTTTSSGVVQDSNNTRSRICTLIAVSTSPKQGLSSQEFEVFDEIASSIEEFYEEQRKTMLANAASNLSLVTSLVSTLQKDVEAIHGIQRQMAKDWRKVEKVLIPFATSVSESNAFASNNKVVAFQPPPLTQREGDIGDDKEESEKERHMRQLQHQRRDQSLVLSSFSSTADQTGLPYINDIGKEESRSNRSKNVQEIINSLSIVTTQSQQEYEDKKYCKEERQTVADEENDSDSDKKDLKTDYYHENYCVPSNSNISNQKLLLSPRSQSVINKLPVISEDRRLMMSSMMMPTISVEESMANANNARSPRALKSSPRSMDNNAVICSTGSVDETIERFPSTAVEASGLGVMDGMYGNQIGLIPSFVHSSSTDVDDTGGSMRCEVERKEDDNEDENLLLENKNGTVNNNGGRLTEEKLHSQNLLNDTPLTLSQKISLLDCAGISQEQSPYHKVAIGSPSKVMDANDMEGVANQSDKKKDLQQDKLRNDSDDFDYDLDAVPVNASKVEIPRLALPTIDNIDNPVVLSPDIVSPDKSSQQDLLARKELQEALQVFSMDLTRFQEANKQLSVAIERTINVARGYLVPDRLQYANSCSHVTSRGLVPCFNELLLTLEQRHYKSKASTALDDSMKGEGGGGKGSPLRRNRLRKGGSSSTVVTTKPKESLLLWSFSVHSILANCPHRTFYDHIAVFLENILSLWSSYSSTIQITVDYEPEDVEMFDDWDEDDDDDIDGDDANNKPRDDVKRNADGEILLLTEEEQYFNPQVPHIYSGKASRSSRKRVATGNRGGNNGWKTQTLSTIPPEVMKELKRQNRLKGNHHKTNNTSKNSHKFYCAMDGFLKITVQFPDKVVSSKANATSRRSEGTRGDTENYPQTDKQESTQEQPTSLNEYPFHQLDPFLHLINSSLVRVNQASAATAVTIIDPLLIDTSPTGNGLVNDGKQDAYQLHVPCLVFLTKEAHQTYFFPKNSSIQVNMNNTNSTAYSIYDRVGKGKGQGNNTKKKNVPLINNSILSNTGTSMKQMFDKMLSSSPSNASLPSNSSGKQIKVEKHVKSLNRNDLIELGIRPSVHSSMMSSCCGLFTCFSAISRCSSSSFSPKRPLKVVPINNDVSSRSSAFLSLRRWQSPASSVRSVSSHGSAGNIPPSPYGHDPSIVRTQSLEEVERFVKTTQKQKKEKEKEHAEAVFKLGNSKDDADHEESSNNKKTLSIGTRSSMDQNAILTTTAAATSSSPLKSFGEMFGIVPIVIPMDKSFSLRSNNSQRSSFSRQQSFEKLSDRSRQKQSPTHGNRSGNDGGRSPSHHQNGKNNNNGGKSPRSPRNKKLKPLYNAATTQLSTQQPSTVDMQ